MKLAEEDYRFWVRIVSKMGLTCTRTGHSPSVPQSGLYSVLGIFVPQCARQIRSDGENPSQALSHHF